MACDGASVSGNSASGYRGTASGVSYVFVKIPAFLSIYLFPAFFSAIGKANATLFIAVFPLIGLLAAIFILPEVYGYTDETGAGAVAAPQPRAAAG